MIRIYKNNDIKYVTKGAYESFYRPLGYNIIIEEAKIEKNLEVKIEKEETIQLDEVKETPKRTRASSNKKVNKED